MTPSTEQQAFGRRLRAERERRRIAIDAIAATMKVKTSTLVRLEAGDVSAMPNGIFRRDYVRQYAAAIGFRGDAIVAEFVELFEEPAPDAAAPSADLRLTLAVDDGWRIGHGWVVAAAVGEAAVLAALAGALAFAGVAPFWPVLALTAIGYYVMSNAGLGRSPARWYVDARAAARRKLATPVDAALGAPSERPA